jgi:(p)ppGpp synthase/HD superfamily hydrolase
MIPANIDAAAYAELDELPRAMMLGITALDGQVDKAGVPKSRHVRAVARHATAFGSTAVAAAYLHDVVEDTDITLVDLRIEFRFSYAVIEVVDAVTRRTGETYDEFIDRIAAHSHLARVVKLADLADNTDPSRPKTREKASYVKERMAKYKRAVATLRAAEAEYRARLLKMVAD